jgi:hypothetical protein
MREAPFIEQNLSRKTQERAEHKCQAFSVEYGNQSISINPLLMAMETAPPTDSTLSFV